MISVPVIWEGCAVRISKSFFCFVLVPDFTWLVSVCSFLHFWPNDKTTLKHRHPSLSLFVLLAAPRTKFLPEYTPKAVYAPD